MDGGDQVSGPDQQPPRKRPWWVSGTTLKNSRNMAFWYSVIFVAYGVFAIVAGMRNPWTVALCVLWGVLAVWAWLSVRYFARVGDSDSDHQR